MEGVEFQYTGTHTHTHTHQTRKGSQALGGYRELDRKQQWAYNLVRLGGQSPFPSPGPGKSLDRFGK